MSRLLPPDGLQPPESLLALMPEDEDAVNLAKRLPSYPPTFGKETLARVLDEQLEFFAQGWLGKDPDKDRARLGLQAVGSAWLEWPCPERLRGAWAGDVELAYEDLKRYWESPSERKPLASATFPAVMQGEGWRFVWEVYAAPPASDDGGRVGYALYSPGQEKGCALVNNLPDAATRDGFQRAVEAAQCLARQIRQEHGLERPDELPNLVVWARPLGSGPVFCEHQPHTPLQAARLWGGSSGTLALAVALLSAYLEEPIDATGSLFSGDLRQTDSGWRVESVGSLDLKERLAGALGEGVEFFGAFVEATPGNNPIGQSFESMWEAVQEQLAPLISAVGKLAELWDRLPNTTRSNTDFCSSTIRLSRVDWGALASKWKGEEQAEETDKDVQAEPSKPEDTEQARDLSQEDVRAVSFEQFLDEASRREFRAAGRPLLITAGAGMGKTFTSRRAAVERARSWMLAAIQGDDPGLLPVWLSLEQIADYTPEGVLESLLASCPSLTEIEQAVLRRAWVRERLLLLLDARDQADRAAGRLATLCEELSDSRPKVSVVLTTRPIRRDALWTEFGGWGPGCVEFRQLEFGPRELARFLSVRLGERKDLTNAIQTYAFTDRGRRARLGVPVIAEFSAELALGDPDFLGELERGLTGYVLYEKLAVYRLKKALADLDYDPSPDKVRQLMLVLGYTASILFDERPGQNLFTEAELAQLRERAGELFHVWLTNEQTGLVLHKSGLLESFTDSGGQANFVHRTLLEFLRGWYLADQYGRTRTVHWDWTSEDDRFPWSLRTLIEKKGWDEQWSEALLFFAQWLDEHSASGPAFAEFLRIVEMEEGDDLLNNRLDIAVRCLRQSWRLYEREHHRQVHAHVFAWSEHACKRFKSLAHPRLLPAKPALFHYRQGEFSGPEDLLAVIWRGHDLATFSRAHVQVVFEKLTDRAPAVRQALVQSLLGWSSHLGDRVQLLSLVARLESDQSYGVRVVAARLLSEWASLGEQSSFLRILGRLESEPDGYVRQSIGHALSHWSAFGDQDVLLRLVDHVETSAYPSMRAACVHAVAGWLAHGDRATLVRLIDSLCNEDDRFVQKSIATAVSRWGPLGDSLLVQNIIQRIEASSETEVSSLLARSISSWSLVATENELAMIIDLLFSLPAQSDAHYNLSDSLGVIVSEWSVLGNAALRSKIWMQFDKVPYAVCDLIAGWSHWGCQSDLRRMVAMLEADRHVSSWALPIARWSTLGSHALLQRLVSFLNTIGNHSTAAHFAMALSSWLPHCDEVLISRILGFIEATTSSHRRGGLYALLLGWASQGDYRQFGRLLERIDREIGVDNRSLIISAALAWQGGPDGRRRFFRDGERLVADLARLS